MIEGLFFLLFVVVIVGIIVALGWACAAGECLQEFEEYEGVRDEE